MVQSCDMLKSKIKMLCFWQNGVAWIDNANKELPGILDFLNFFNYSQR